MRTLRNAPSWQFHVIWLGPLVLKIPKSPQQAAQAIRRSRWGEVLDERDIEKLALEVTENACKSIDTVWKTKQAHHLCGAPRRLLRAGYMQRRGTTFLDAFQGGRQHARKIIDDYFELTIKLWKHRLFEMSFDFLRNCGYRPDGQAFQIDLGDFTGDYGKACLILQQQRWMKRLDLECLKTEEQLYYIDCAMERFTFDGLNAVWGR